MGTIWGVHVTNIPHSIDTLGGTAHEIPEASPSRDEVFTMLSNQRRRWVLYYLKRDEEGKTDLRTLVDALTAWEYEMPIEDISWKKRKRIYTALRQSHLPKLADAGIIEYDRSRGTVELTEDAQEVQMYLEYVPAHDIPWSQFYLGLSAVGALLIALVWASVYPFQGLSGQVLSAIILLMFGVSSLVHHSHLRRSALGAREEPPK